MQRDGTFQQLSSAERANFLLQLSSLQQAEIGQRIAQAGLQPNAQANVLNTRRVPFELSAVYQANSRDWFEAYVLYAQVIQNLITASCNPATGQIGGGTGVTPANGLPAAGVNGAGAGNIALLCRTINISLPICNGLR